ncbi:MAG: acetoacetate decarboxylase [Rhodocyclaceae bacterium]|nr:acetoacetate decarboxylase [Rhodocyclaceae bacterium]MBX3668598.1 acetoacetate decarboxylase [Rhodocyclaceae bacterium]
MKIEDILMTASMPIASPTYPKGPYRFVNREYMIISYESDPAAIREAVPEPLQPDGSNTVLYEFIRMPDSTGFGDYTESGIVIPCTYKGESVNFVAQMYLDCEPPISGGREIWGFPKKLADVSLKVNRDTLAGRLEYGDQLVAVASMAYKHENAICAHHGSQMCDVTPFIRKLTKTQVNLKIIPDVDGSPAIAQLVAYNLTDVQVKGAWESPARLHLIPHVNAPVADLPVRRVVGGTHFVADLTLPYGRVLYDYLKEPLWDARSAMSSPLAAQLA